MEEIDKEDFYNKLIFGIENKEIIIYLQPKFEIKTNKLVGAEALVRWKVNNQIIMPNVFIPILEENKLINILDMYVFRNICKLLNKWKELNYKVIPISVNESRLHLYNNNYINDLKELIKKYNIMPNTIELEMTETTVVHNIELAKKAEKDAHKLGFVVSMDDFGTGYSSFSMLKDINIDILKIDKSFFDDILENKKGKIIVESIIKMSHRLNIKVVAEGIEKEEQLKYLRKIECDMVQGYIYDKPIPIKEFENKYLK